MIVEPLNDRECLGKITAVARQWASTADRQGSKEQLIARLRSLPQRNDDGRSTASTVACEYPVRLRQVAHDPNCVERAAHYLAAAEALDPSTERALITLDLPQGRHTLPVERLAGEWVPVDLSPRSSSGSSPAGRNCAMACHRNAEASEVLRDIFSVAHPVAEVGLGLIGLWPVAYLVGELEKKGLEELELAEERRKGEEAMRNADTSEVLRDVKNVVHPIGTFVLSIFGAGAAAEILGDLEEQGLAELERGEGKTPKTKKPADQHKPSTDATDAPTEAPKKKEKEKKQWPRKPRAK